MTSHIVFISVGSNIGDKMTNCQKGIDCLSNVSDVKLLMKAPYYRTEPVDYLDQDWFVNTVIKVGTRLSPKYLLARTQAAQIAIGRKASTIRFGPRVLDLDILIYDNLIMESPSLTIPHPRMHERRFVLQPICDIAPNWVHPLLEKSMQTLLAELPENEQQVIPN